MAEKEPPQDPPKLKVVDGGARRRGFVTLQIYSQLADLYVVQGFRTLRRLAIESGISKDTCAKAITTGWPERGWPPLRERAAQYDQAQQAANPKPIGERLVIEAEKYREMKQDHLLVSRAYRQLLKNTLPKLDEAVLHATAWRTGVQVRVVDVQVGKRIVQRVVKENVRLPPYLPDVVSAMASLSQVHKAVTEVDLRFEKFEPNEPGERPGWDKLSDEQLDKYIASGGKDLPDGMTIEDMRRKT